MMQKGLLQHYRPTADVGSLSYHLLLLKPVQPWEYHFEDGEPITGFLCVRYFGGYCPYHKVRATEGRHMSIIRPSPLFKITAFFFSIWIGNSVACSADQQSIPPAKAIEFEGDPPFTPKPLTLKGYLRRPDGAGRYPAVVLLHGCGGIAERLDQNWGQRLASWGYATLTIDLFGPCGIGNICGKPYPRDLEFDAYRGLNFLVRQPFVDAKRIVAMGFSQGGSLALLSVERGAIEQTYENKFRAAVAFYPFCDELKGIAVVPALILIGEHDAFTPGCRDMVDGRGGDFGTSRTTGEGAPIRLVVYPEAYQGFDVLKFKTPVDYLGYHLEFNQSAADQSIDELREFLHATIGGRQ
jgi:dienelactone hydrolase